MKTISQNFIFSLFVCGVFGVGADEAKTVMEGDSVTLNSDLTEIHTYRRILWRFGTELIAQITEGKISYKDGPDGRFRDRLQLDSKTASLTITNMRRNHSGLYKLEPVSERETTDKKFSVNVYDSPPAIVVGEVEIKSVSVMEGGPVTLQTDVTETHGDELIVVRFGDEGKLIAKHDIEAKSSPIYDTDEKFRDRLKLDEKTGSLTITDSRTTDSGIYTVKISSSNKQTLYKRFTVIVSDSGPSSGVIIGIVVAVLLPVVVVVAAAAVIYKCSKRSELEKHIGSIQPEPVSCVEGKCAVLHSYHKIQKGVQMLWRHVSVKDSAIASVSENDKKTYWYDTRFRGRLQLDPQTGSLIIRNLKKTDAGVYFLEINCRGGIKYRKYEVTVSGEVETVSVKEGDDVTLMFSEKSEDYINWMFEEKRGFIASLKIKDNRNDNVCEYPDERSFGRFRGRLELKTQTGSLTIKNIRTEHTGLYRVITGPGYICKKSFNVVFDDFTETSGNESVITAFWGQIQRFCGLARIDGVFGEEKDEMKTLPLMEGDDLKLNTDTEILTDDEIILRFETSFRKICPYVTIARFSKLGNEFKSEERRFKDRLQRDLTGPLTITITNFKTTDYGDYYVQITNKTKKSFKSFTFTVVSSGDVVKSVSVMNGKPINLNTNITDLQKEDQMLWTFGPHGMIIANTYTERCDEIFKKRVELNKTTGSLTITNSTKADDGMYHLQIISSNNRVINQRFNVTVNKMIVSVKEGEPVTLDPDTVIQKDDQIQWRVGDQDILIAEIRGGARETHDADGRFGGRLKLNKTTGSLTVTNSTEADDGMYHLHIISNNRVINQRFNVAVNKMIVFVEEEEPVTLETETEIQKDDQIQWRFGDQDILIAEIRGGAVETHDDDVRFRGRLTLNKTTGSLTITNTTTADAGDYKLLIKSNSGDSDKTFRVVVSESRYVRPGQSGAALYDIPKPPPPDQLEAGNKVNEATVEMPPVNEEDLDAGNEQEGMSLLVIRHAHQ